MVERLGHPIPSESGFKHPRPPESGETKREVELRPIAENLITALESEDRELKIEAVVDVLSRFELKKPPIEPKTWTIQGHRFLVNIRNRLDLPTQDLSLTS